MLIRLSRMWLFLPIFALLGCAHGAPATPLEPVIRFVEIRPEMSDAQARDPEGCGPPLAETAGDLAQEDVECSARADALVRWVRDLQALILGGDHGAQDN